jgi:FMN phosphatase YigB (HAD superfamily)
MADQMNDHEPQFVPLTPENTQMSAEQIERAQGRINQTVRDRWKDIPAPQGQIRNVIFDFGEVLVHWDPYGPLSSRYDSDVITDFRNNTISGFDDANDVSDHGGSLEDASRVMDRHDPFWGAMMRFYLHHFDQSLMGEIPGARQLVEDLHRAGYRCWGLSNWSPENFHWVPGSYPVISELDGYLVSGFVHKFKPHKDIFDLACQKFGITPASSVFIDDKPRNVNASRSYGFSGIVQKTPQQVRRDLQQLGVHIPDLIQKGDMAARPQDNEAGEER